MPSTRNHTAIQAVLAVLSVAVLAYSFLIVQQILLGLIVVAVPWIAYAVVYVLLRFVRALERIASALEEQGKPESGRTDNHQRGGVEDE
ncbi:hypothetical protein ACOZ4I_07660 [Haloarcula salina]|uniref:hypothetical protein n=1 Tax=Haloarcula salina TaxID=1429914 RepID=UPI003C6FF392